VNSKEPPITPTLPFSPLVFRCESCGSSPYSALATYLFINLCVMFMLDDVVSQLLVDKKLLELWLPPLIILLAVDEAPVQTVIECPQVTNYQSITHREKTCTPSEHLRQTWRVRRRDSSVPRVQANQIEGQYLPRNLFLAAQHSPKAECITTTSLLPPPSQNAQTKHSGALR
jgi:hypothetical protein